MFFQFGNELGLGAHVEQTIGVKAGYGRTVLTKKVLGYVWLGSTDEHRWKIIWVKAGYGRIGAK